MMVTNNKIDPFAGSIFHFILRLYPTIKGYHKTITLFNSVIYTFYRNAIPFGISIGYIIVASDTQPFQKSINQGYSSGSIHIIVTKNKDSFFTGSTEFYP